MKKLFTFEKGLNTDLYVLQITFKSEFRNQEKQRKN